jgi:hypothetical protein
MSNKNAARRSLFILAAIIVAGFSFSYWHASYSIGEAFRDILEATADISPKAWPFVIGFFVLMFFAIYSNECYSDEKKAIQKKIDALPIPLYLVVMHHPLDSKTLNFHCLG